MERRKFLIGLGALSAGSATAVGSSAFSTATMDRTVDVVVDGDSDASVALQAGPGPSIEENSDTVSIDLTGNDGAGINEDAVYEWGDSPVGYDETYDGPYPNHPGQTEADDYAFKLVNKGPAEYETVRLIYELDDASWVKDSWDNDDLGYGGGNRPECSYIQFRAWDTGSHYHHSWFAAPYWGGDQVDVEDDTTYIHEIGANFTQGMEIPFTIRVDTTGDLADTGQDLSGSLTIQVEDQA